MMYKFEILKIEELDELCSLIKLVFRRNSEYVISKTRWAFYNDHSFVIVAKYNGLIVASRGGFDWPITYNENTIKAIQFHGTCVHPDHRRKGLFTKLNLIYIEKAQKKDVKYIFNVSVKNSRLGYEKLGWIYLNGFHRLTFFHNPIKFIKSKMIDSGFNSAVSHKPSSIQPIPQKFLEARARHFINTIHTKYSVEFLKWRLDNKEEFYRVFQNEDVFVIYKIIYSNNIKSLVFGDFFLLENSKNQFNKAIKAVLKKEKPDISFTYISRFHPYFNFYLMNFYLPNPFNFNLNLGVRSLYDKDDSNLSERNWAFSFLDIDTF